MGQRPETEQVAGRGRAAARHLGESGGSAFLQGDREEETGEGAGTVHVCVSGCG